MIEIISKLQEPLIETILLTLVPLVLSVIFGFIIGTIIFITGDNGVIEVKGNALLMFINRISDGLVNIFRSIPYFIAKQIEVYCTPKVCL